jgi:hypothetical protein
MTNHPNRSNPLFDAEKYRQVAERYLREDAQLPDRQDFEAVKDKPVSDAEKYRLAQANKLIRNKVGSS